MNVKTFPVHIQAMSSQTIKTYRSDLQLFRAFLSERSVTDIAGL